MKQFIAHIEKSIFGPEYYEELLTRPSSFSWKYYWSFTMLLAVVMTIVTSLPLIPQVNRALRELPPAVLAYYPDTLEVKVEKGLVSSNVEEPYYLPIPERWREFTGPASSTRYLGVIDTKSPVSVEQFRSYSSFFWVAKDTIVSADSERDVHLSLLDSSMNFVVNEQAVEKGIRAVEPYFAFAAPVMVVAIFFAFALRFVFNLLFLVLAALLVLLLGRLLKRAWKYGTAYRIALHAVTLPLLVEQLFLLLPGGGFQIPFFTTATLLLVVYVNFRKTDFMEESIVPPSGTSV